MINNIHESWRQFFLKLIDTEFFRAIDQLDNEDIYPNKENIFRVFEMPLDDIKVIILGQDPYPNANQAIGLDFAVSAETNMPVSLRNIQKEIGHDIDRTLIPWSKQGVFLLNTALTVKRKQAGSHIKLWHYFTAKLIKFISEHHPSIWMLWGKKAQDHISFINNYVYDYPSIGEENRNIILMAAHPAAESYKQNAGFFGCDHFNMANRVLNAINKENINWY